MLKLSCLCSCVSYLQLIVFSVYTSLCNTNVVLMVISFLHVSFKVKLLFEENRTLDEANKKLLSLLDKEQKHRSERKHSASNSTKVKVPVINHRSERIQ
jgi:hypothetical protein